MYVLTEDGRLVNLDELVKIEVTHGETSDGRVLHYEVVGYEPMISYGGEDYGFESEEHLLYEVHILDNSTLPFTGEEYQAFEVEGEARCKAFIKKLAEALKRGDRVFIVGETDGDTTASQ